MTGTQDRDPIVVADTGPLIRLAAAGLLGKLRGLNRRIVLVDRVEAEAVGDLNKPFAKEIKEWIDTMGDAVLRVSTVVGVGLAELQSKQRTDYEDMLLKKSLRNSGEKAMREFIELWNPDDHASALVVYEDRGAAALFTEAEFPVTIMTTRRFANLLKAWGISPDAREKLEKITPQFTLQPSRYGEYPAELPFDMRMLPQEDEGP